MPLAERGISSFEEITNERSWDFVSWYVKHHEEVVVDRSTRGRKKTWASAHNVLHIVSQAFQQGPALIDKGYGVMPEPPYSGRTALNVVENDLKLRRGNKLDPLPDNVAIPSLSVAAKWVEHYAEDIIGFQAEYLRCGREAKSKYLKKRELKKLFHCFRFSIEPGTGRPWVALNKTYFRYDKDNVKRKIVSGIIPRRLVSDLLAACVIVLQGFTGVRSSDLASLHLEAEESEHGLPTCVKVQKSLDGLMDVFLLRGVEQKETHEVHEWVLGARLAGVKSVPVAVKAVVMLERLLGPYRKAGGSDALIITMKNGRGLSLKPENVGSATSNWLSNIQRDFIKSHAGLPLTTHLRGERRDLQFRAQRWRATFAHFVLRTNKRALGPLARHFHHANTLMTELGYIGNDPEMRKMMDDLRVTQAAEVLYEVVTNPKGVTGRFADFIQKGAPDLQKELTSKSVKEAIEQLRGIIIEHDLRLHFTDYGACAVAIRPMAARCHEIGGTTSASNVLPNPAFREPSVCASCRNFLVRAENLSYWEERQAQLESLLKSHAAGSEWIFRRQLAQARQIVKSLRS